MLKESNTKYTIKNLLEMMQLKPEYAYIQTYLKLKIF